MTDALRTSVVGSHARPSWFVSGIDAAERGEFGPTDLAEMLDDGVIVPEGFDLDRELAQGLAGFGDRGEPLSIEIDCAPGLANVLAETPLSADQVMARRDNGSARITATVSDAWQLRWWLLSQGEAVEVCGPEGLREEIIGSLEGALRRYRDKPKTESK